MVVATYNWTWQQGEDLVMSLVYNEGPDGSEVPKNLTGYSLRMDIVSVAGQRLFTLNSADIPGDTTVDVVGVADNEATLDASGNINITISRTITLPPNGALNSSLSQNASTVFNYDMFLRNPAGKQQKILRGTITVEPSYTLWA